MKARVSLPLQSFLLLIFYTVCYASPRAGFFLPDSVTELTLRFTTVRNLIVLPVIINDSITVNLILDTGCRNLVLFGKNFQKLLRLEHGREIQFSGFGSGSALKANLSLDNSVSIGSIVGENLPIIVVPDKNIFGSMKNIHGIIGYDVFLKFEIEINSLLRTITFRPALSVTPPADYSLIPLSIIDSKPVMAAAKFYGKKETAEFDLMIDTGSSLGILLQTKTPGIFRNGLPESVIGHGLNGIIRGYQTLIKKLKIDRFEISTVRIGVIESGEDHASIGMDILKEFIVIINYCQAYACFRPTGGVEARKPGRGDGLVRRPKGGGGLKFEI
jgi:hypothetical protein